MPVRKKKAPAEPEGPQVATAFLIVSYEGRNVRICEGDIVPAELVHLVPAGSRQAAPAEVADAL